MNLVIYQKDKRIPLDLIKSKKEYELWSVQEFLSKGNSDTGIEVSPNESIFLNLECVTEEIYQSLANFKDAYIDVRYYRWSDQEIPDKEFVKDVIVYDAQELKKDKEPDKPKSSQVKPKEKPVEKSPAPEPKKEEKTKEDGMVVAVDQLDGHVSVLDVKSLDNMLNFDEGDLGTKKEGSQPGKVILFGSSKGGTGKTFTSLISQHYYQRMHPDQRICFADFDVVDGQVGITINKVTPTLMGFFDRYDKYGDKSFDQLESFKVKSERFGSNLDFYLSPPYDVDRMTDNNDFWKTVFELLITHYDVCFFDSGTDYLGKEPISMLYKIADKILLTSNVSINSVKSIIRQLKSLSGQRKNPVFKPEYKIISRVSLILTRIAKDTTLNKNVIKNLMQYAPVVQVFGNIDNTVLSIQYNQTWDLLYQNENIVQNLKKITDLSDV